MLHHLLFWTFLLFKIFVVTSQDVETTTSIEDLIEEQSSTTVLPPITELTTSPVSWFESYQQYFNRHHNQTLVNLSGSSLPVPATLSESVLRGLNSYGLDRFLFPRSFQNMMEPLKTILNILLRLPIIIVGLIVGEYTELLGLQTMQLGNALLLLGVQGFGYTLREYAIGFIAFGKTVKEWFVNNNLPSFNSTENADDSILFGGHAGEGPSYGYFWNKIGNSFLETRLEIEELYGSHF